VTKWYLPLLIVVLLKRTVMCCLCKCLEALTVGQVEYTLHSCVTWHQSCEIMTFVRGVNTGQLTGAEMKGCQVGDWTVGERDMRVT